MLFTTAADLYVLPPCGQLLELDMMKYLDEVPLSKINVCALHSLFYIICFLNEIYMKSSFNNTSYSHSQRAFCHLNGCFEDGGRRRTKKFKKNKNTKNNNKRRKKKNPDYHCLFMIPRR